MKRLLLAAGITVAFFGLSLAAGEWTGHISDSKCGAAHSDHSEKSINCVRACVKGGQKPVFVTADKKVLSIANPDKVMNYLGHQVKVTGELKGETLNVASVQNVAP
jgi:hypothetical protein